MSDRHALVQFCKAQAQINRVDADMQATRKALSERVATYKTLIEEQMVLKGLSCLEVHDRDGVKPVYFRLKQSSSTPPLTTDLVLHVLTKVDGDALLGVAEQSGNDLPRMFANLLADAIRTTYTKRADKQKLSVSPNRERGVRPCLLPPDLAPLAKDYMEARDELSGLRHQTKEKKQPLLEHQKEVEESVKRTLHDVDPVSMTTKVHMQQDGDEWVYYLRCKQKQASRQVGVRKLVPLVESVMASTMVDRGLSREYSSAVRFENAFWDQFRAALDMEMSTLTAPQTVSKICLDKGAPRRRAH